MTNTAPVAKLPAPSNAVEVAYHRLAQAILAPQVEPVRARHLAPVE